MSKNLEITKAINNLGIDQKKATEELLVLIDRIIDYFEDGKEEYLESIFENSVGFGCKPEDYADDPDAYYANISSLINGLINNLNTSLENFSKIILSYNQDFPTVEEIVSEQSKLNEQIWQIFNELKKYAENEEDQEEYDYDEDKASYEDRDYDEDEEDDEDEDTLSSSFGLLKLKLISFEENYIILIKLYNKETNLKLSVPVSFFSTTESLSENPLVRRLTNKGIIIE